MLYHGISRVSVLGLCGTLYVRKVRDAEGVSVQTEGPYEAKVVDDCWLMIYPEGQEPIFLQSHSDLTSGRTHVGSVDVAARARFLTDSRPRVRARASNRAQAIIRITAPPGIRFELTGCYGRRKGPRGWRRMRGNSWFDVR
jgi:hypothetical protein